MVSKEGPGGGPQDRPYRVESWVVGRRACVLTKRSQGLSKSFTKPYKIQIHRGLPESARRPRNSGSPLNTTHVYTYHPTPGPHTRRPRVPTSTTLIQNVRHHPPSHRERVGPPPYKEAVTTLNLPSEQKTNPPNPPPVGASGAAARCCCYIRCCCSAYVS